MMRKFFLSLFVLLGLITGAHAQGTWTGALSLSLAYMPHGFLNYQYLLLNYNPPNKAVLLVYEHENSEGDNCYTNGGTACTALSNTIANGGAGPQDWYNNAGFQSRYCASGCIIALPYADQTPDPSGQNSNFGGYGDSPDSQPNERAVVAMIQQLQTNLNIDATRIYATGDSLGGIGSWALCLDHGGGTGSVSKIIAACMPFSGDINRSGYGGFGSAIANSVAAQIQGGPVIMAVNGVGDTTSSNPANWTNPVWNALAGNSNYPGGPAGGRAGTTPYYYLLDTGLSHDVWDTYRPLPAGQPMLDLLFAQRLNGSSGGTLTGTPMAPLPAGYLSVSGNQIQDGNGNNVRLACNGYFQVGQTGSASSDLALMRKQGFNCVRVEWFDAQNCPGGTCNFSTFDTIVNGATANNMKVIFDHHANEGGGNCGSQQSNGLWYDVNGPAPWNVTNNTDGCGTTGTVTYAQFKANWLQWANHYKGNSTVIGFDLDNEPTTYGNIFCCSGSIGTNWGTGNGGDMRAMVNDVGAAIEAADPGVLIIVEGIINNGTLFNGVTRGSAQYPVINGPQMDLTTVATNPPTCCAGKLVYSVHEYPTSISSSTPDSGPNMTTIRNTAWGYLVQQNLSPVWIGEIGASLDNSNGNLTDETAWATGVTQYLNGQSTGGPTFTGCQQPFSSDWWAFGYLAGEIPDGTLNQDFSSKAGQQQYWSTLLYTTCSSQNNTGPGTPVLAQRAGDFTNFESVQGCFTQGGSAQCLAGSPAGTSVLTDLNYLGVSHIRSGLDITMSGNSLTMLTTVLNGGKSFVTQVPYGLIAPANQISQAHAWQAINGNAVYATEGINEPELASITYNGGNWPGTALNPVGYAAYGNGVLGTTAWPGGGFTSGSAGNPTVYTGYKFSGAQTISGSYITFVQCDWDSGSSGVLVSGDHITFQGNRFQSNSQANYNVQASGTNIVISYSSFTPRAALYTSPPGAAWPSAGAGQNTTTFVTNTNTIDGTSGYQYGLDINGNGPLTVDHSDFWGFGNDAIQWRTSATTTWTVTNNWMHDPANPSPNNYHTDGVGYVNSGAGPSNVTIQGNTIAGIGNTNAIAFQAATSGYNNIQIIHNYLSGFGYTFAAGFPNGGQAFTNSAFEFNVIGTDLAELFGPLYNGSWTTSTNTWKCNTINFLPGTTWSASGTGTFTPTSGMNGQYWVPGTTINSATDFNGNTTCSGQGNSWNSVADYMNDYIKAVSLDSALHTFQQFGVSRPGAETDNSSLQFATVPSPQPSGTYEPAGAILTNYLTEHIYPMDQNFFHSPGVAAACQTKDPTAGSAFTIDRHWNYVTTFNANFTGYANDAAAAAVPHVVTEFGYATSGPGPSANGDRVTEAKKAACILTGLLNGWQDGMALMNIYAMYDTSGSGFGLMSGTGTPNTSGTYLHNMNAILADTGTTARSFMTGTLTYALTGFPANGGQQLFQKSNGDYFLVLWDNSTNWNTATGSAISVGPTSVTVTVTNGTVASIGVYDVTQGTAAIQNFTGTNTVTVSVTDTPIIIDFNVGGANVGGTSWNPNDKAANITLSGSNQVATNVETAAGSVSVRSTTSLASGKVCAEYVMTGLTTNWDVGLANSSFNLTISGGLGIDSNGIGFDPLSGPNGIFLNGGTPLSTGSGTAVTGDKATMCADLANRLIWFTTAAMRAAGNSWNNSASANPATGAGGISFASLVGPYFLIFNTFDPNSTSIATLNAAGPFAIATPAGFMPWQQPVSSSTHPFILIFGANDNIPQYANDNGMLAFATPVDLTQ